MAGDLLDRNFTAESPGVAMVGDTTAIETTEGGLFLAILVDLCTRAIVGRSIVTKNDTEIVSREFRRAMRKLYPITCLHTTRTVATPTRHGNTEVS
jgi:transposase InsO family protein